MAHPEHALSESDRLGRLLVLDEIFDLSLYRALRDVATGRLRGMLDELILVETRHVAFWQEFFGLKHITSLDPARRLKLPSQAAESPMASALVVGSGYFAGAVVPVLPVLFGATGLLPTIVTAGAMIVAVSAIVAFISGMAVTRRIVLNLIITGIAVAVTYAIGLTAKAVWGIAL